MKNKTISVWCVRRPGFLEYNYYRVASNGNFDPTDNPKLAMRWFDWEPANAFAARLGWPWKAVLVTFPANEPIKI